MPELREFRPERFANHSCSKNSNYHESLLAVEKLQTDFAHGTLPQKSKLAMAGYTPRRLIETSPDRRAEAFVQQAQKGLSAGGAFDDSSPEKRLNIFSPLSL